MGRYLPTECHHGTQLDWGDFGPCQDCDEHPGEECPNIMPPCSRCEAEAAAHQAVLWSLAADSVRGFLMSKNVGWDDLDPWTDNIIARVREQVQTGGGR